MAYALGVGFVPIRKKGKLPGKCMEITYQKEYEKDTVEMHEDAIKKGQKVLLIDDLLATGGTVKANIELIEKLGGKIVGLGFLIELDYCGGRQASWGQVRHLLVDNHNIQILFPKLENII